jgi:D-beta-D-heptose 7-phosphate kinase/D-beta-D-heptose 1-phosphate adenosyltransferase
MRTHRRSQHRLSGKIKSLKALKELTAKLKRQGKRIAFTNGCFDILHYGHARYLQDAKKSGDILVVGVNSDRSVRKIKGKDRPVVAEKNRLGLLAALESVDYLVLFKEATPLKVIQAVKPDILIKGADWNKNNIVGSGFVASYGGKVKTVKLVKRAKQSTVRRIIDANINRVKEGLRVCEEITRFILNSRSLTLRLKESRHQIDAAAKNLGSRNLLLKERLSLSDVGKNIYVNELKRGSLGDIFFANIQRAKESVRVLEEFSKLINVDSSLRFKKVRYKIYAIEKKAAARISALRAH